MTFIKETTKFHDLSGPVALDQIRIAVKGHTVIGFRHVYDKEEIMTRPESLFEAASYDLNKFRERRMTDRRFMARDTPDRRKAQPIEGASQQAKDDEAADTTLNKSSEEDSQT
jgi:hypothetical protein